MLEVRDDLLLDWDGGFQPLVHFKITGAGEGAAFKNYQCP